MKFSLSADERPVLAADLPVESLDRDPLGLAIARLLAVCDLLLDESAHWIWAAGRRPPPPDRPSRGEALLHRYAPQLGELIGTERA